MVPVINIERNSRTAAIGAFIESIKGDSFSWCWTSFFATSFTTSFFYSPSVHHLSFYLLVAHRSKPDVNFLLVCKKSINLVDSNFDLMTFSFRDSMQILGHYFRIHLLLMITKVVKGGPNGMGVKQTEKEAATSKKIILMNWWLSKDGLTDLPLPNTKTISYVVRLPWRSLIESKHFWMN